MIQVVDKKWFNLSLLVHFTQNKHHCYNDAGNKALTFVNILCVSWKRNNFLNDISFEVT